jgi:hypothetical protein
MKNLFIVLLIILFASCTKKSSKIDSNEIYQKYRIEYNESKYSTEVRCKITKKKSAGAKIKFVDNDYLSIMGTQATFDSYTYNYETEYLQFIDSVYINIMHKGTSINNYFLFDDVLTCSIPLSQTTVYLGFYWDFYWDGPPLGNDDEIKIEIFDQSGSEVYSKRSGSNDYTYISMSPSDYGENISQGTYRMKITREKKAPLVMYTGSGGEAELVYIDEEYITFY